MSKITLLLLVALSLTGMATAQRTNTLSKAERKSGWVLLFDGKTTKGWHNYLKNEVSPAWSARNGELRFTPPSDKAHRGDLVTDAEYENFELRLEWQIASGGNSGIIFSVKEDPKYRATYLTGIEMQVLDNISAADNKIPNHLAGALYDLTGDTSVSKPKPVGEWNEARIRKQDGRITLWLNGIQTADVQIGSPEWQSMLDKSKFRTWEGFARYNRGKIALQDHGDMVAYRTIKLKEL